MLASILFDADALEKFQCTVTGVFSQRRGSCVKVPFGYELELSRRVALRPLAKFMVRPNAIKFFRLVSNSQGTSVSRRPPPASHFDYEG